MTRKRLVPLAVLVLVAAGATAPALAPAAGPVYWDYPATVPFARCELAGAAVDEWGQLVPGLTAVAWSGAGPEIVWCGAADERGDLALGSGHDGQVWLAPRAGEPRLLATLPQPEIFAVARAGGALYAGGGPDGLVFRVEADGRHEAWADLDESYVWALASGADGTLYAGAGAPAAVYRLDKRGAARRLAALPAQHVLALAVTAAGRLLAATQGPGLVCALDPASGSWQVLAETDQDEVRQLATGPDGAWYALAVARGGGGGAPAPEPGEPPAGALPAPGPLDAADLDLGGGPGAPPPGRSALYRVAPDGVVELFWSGEVPLHGVAHTPRWGWLAVGPRPAAAPTGAALLGAGSAAGSAAAGGAVWALTAGAGARPLATWEQGEPVALLAAAGGGRGGGGEGGALAATIARPGGLVRLEARAASAAAALSPPLDGRQPVRWGRLRWEGDAGGAAPRWRVRGGPRAEPDSTWTAWSESWSEADHAIPLPPSRYLQWRVELDGAERPARVSGVTVSGYAPNLAPRILRLEVLPPGVVRADGGGEPPARLSEQFRGGLKVDYSLDAGADPRATPEQAAPVRPVRMVVWEAADPNGDRLLYRLEYRRLGETSWRAVGRESPQAGLAWDTAAVPDGDYELQLTATDRLDNRPDEALAAVRLGAPVRVDHTPPRLTGLTVRRERDGFALACAAQDEASPLARAWVVLPDGQAARLDPRDGICDSLREEFAWSLAWPPAGVAPPPEPWRLGVGVADRAGNVAVAEGEAR